MNTYIYIVSVHMDTYDSENWGAYRTREDAERAVYEFINDNNDEAYDFANDDFQGEWLVFTSRGTYKIERMLLLG